MSFGSPSVAPAPAPKPLPAAPTAADTATAQIIETQKQRQLELQREYEAQSAQLESDLADTIRARDEEIERRRAAGEDPGIGTGKLGNPTRLQIYRTLVRSGHSGLAVGQVQEQALSA